MLMNSKTLIRATAILGFTILGACSSGVKKADIPATANPAEEITKLESTINTGFANQVDLLAYKDMKKAEASLSDARELQRKGKAQDKILAQVAEGQGYMARANAEAEKNRPQADAILQARAASAKAGATSHPVLKEKFADLDEDVRDDSDNFTKTLNADKFAKYQKGYLDLELAGIQEQQLGTARANIKGSSDMGAEKWAPQSYRTAMTDMKSAENLIAANHTDTTTFSPAVAKANQSANTLLEVMKVMKASKKGAIDEKNALRMVAQNAQIASLNNNLGQSQAQLNTMSNTVQSQNAALSQSQKLVNLQNALKAAQAKFNKDEAEVYQQGDKLLIRLKKMNFASGTSDLPESSLDLLAKVKDVAMGLNPSEIVVEGHTDSVGKPEANKSLSQSRAQSVAKYFESNTDGQRKIEAVGYGFEKPIATNKTKTGRSQNRRVDVVITPSDAAPAANGSNPGTVTQ